MLTKEAYAYYEAGCAVAAVHCRLRLRQVSINAAHGNTDVAFPRDGLKLRATLWLTGLAAERKGVGEADPFRRSRCRQRLRQQVADYVAGLDGEMNDRQRAGRLLISQAQDRANAICGSLFEAIQQVAGKLVEHDLIAGAEVERIVAEVRARNQQPSPEPCD